MVRVESMELNTDDQNVAVQATELIKVEPGQMSDFEVVFARSDIEENNKNFILNVVNTYTAFPDHLKVLGVVRDDWWRQKVIVYS